MKKTAVVILNWNGRHFLEKFLPSVVANTNAEVIVADNGSTDGSLDFLATSYPTLRTIALDRNYGFASGYNKAMAQIEADYYVLLNDDVECTPGWVEPVIEMMERDPEIAIAQPKLMMYDQRDTFEYAGAAGGFIDSFGYPFCRGRLFNQLERDCGQYDDQREVFWATGAAMFVRADVWHRLGGLDDDFFAHMEEIDFCWRARNAGYKVMYCPQSTLYHVGGGTLPKSSPFKTELNFRNNLSMLYKNLPQKRLRRTMAMRMMLDIVAAFKFLAEGKAGEYRAVLKAHREYRAWKPMLQAKRAALPQREVSCIYRGHILTDYYLLRRQRFSDLKF
ncbi:MAG: glycosyltransferase family 2 protein [Bacteroidales bacterium]|nr:glycosyltransferase family 2 protein [Bacteroidales bacterium]